MRISTSLPDGGLKSAVARALRFANSGVRSDEVEAARPGESDATDCSRGSGWTRLRAADSRSDPSTVSAGAGEVRSWAGRATRDIDVAVDEPAGSEPAGAMVSAPRALWSAT